MKEETPQSEELRWVEGETFLMGRTNKPLWDGCASANARRAELQREVQTPGNSYITPDRPSRARREAGREQNPPAGERKTEIYITKIVLMRSWRQTKKRVKANTGL